MSAESGMGGIPALTDAEREALRAQLESWFGDPRQAFLVSEIAPVVARIKADAVVAALASVERLADEWLAATCITDGAPCSFHRHADGYAIDLRAALAEGKGGER